MVQSKSDRERQKIITDKCQSLIEALLKSEDNKFCVDCDAKGPRWASWNLGIFLCIRCAGIHRNLGVHISKVKSVNLDAWTPDHVAYVQRMGNGKARKVYEANLPEDFRRPQTDTALESFIRAKYEQKKYIIQGWTDPGPPQPAFNADEELKRIKEQKRNKANSNASKMISISDIQLTNPKPRPADMSNLKDKMKNVPGLVDSKTVAATEAANKSEKTNADLLKADFESNLICESPSISSTVPNLLESVDTNLNASSNILELDQSINLSTQDKSKKMLTKESILSLYSFSTSTSSSTDPFGMSTSVLVQTPNAAPASTQIPFNLNFNAVNQSGQALNSSHQNQTPFYQGNASASFNSAFNVNPLAGHLPNDVSGPNNNIIQPASQKSMNKLDELFSGLDILHNSSANRKPQPSLEKQSATASKAEGAILQPGLSMSNPFLG